MQQVPARLHRSPSAGRLWGAVLYLYGLYLLCRRCHGLVQESEREDRACRLMHKVQKIHRRLGGSGSLLESLPPKPKRMRWWTYERLCRQAVEAGLAACLRWRSAWRPCTPAWSAWTTGRVRMR